MPAPGVQYGDVKNPFEERVVDMNSARDIATLQSRLNKQLGPEYISTRPGQGGGRVAYLEGNKAIALANEVFGFNGWSSSLGHVQIDFVDELPSGKFSLGLSIVVRITLKCGTYHEDIGYGSTENGKGKAAAFEKAKKEAATDGLKRALRTFGNVLGNCLYDKEYLKKVQTMKVKPVKFKEDNLHRHADFAPTLPPPQQEESHLVKKEPNATLFRSDGNSRARTEQLSNSLVGEFDDDDDGNLFDGVELSEYSHGNVPEPTDHPAAQNATAPEPSSPSGKTVANQKGETVRPANQRVPIAPQGGSMNGQTPLPQKQQRRAPGRHSVPQVNHKVPQTLVQQPSIPYQDVDKTPAQPLVAESHMLHHHAPLPNHVSLPPDNQPLRPTPPPIQSSINRPDNSESATALNDPPTAHRPPVGFITSRAAELMQHSDSPSILTYLPAFNPKVDSPVPQDKRTPGVDRTRSVPIKRQDLVAETLRPSPPTQAAPTGPGNTIARPNLGPRGNSNFVNPHQDMSRRIGMPGGNGVAVMSPCHNRGAYRPPMKRPPLQDVSNQNLDTGVEYQEVPATKRAKVDPTPGEKLAGLVSTVNTIAS